MKTIKNNKAEKNFFLYQELEAGIVLKGSEIKSIRTGKVSFKDSFAGIENNEVYLYNLHISPYVKANIFNHDPTRKRKLLLHRHQIRRLKKKVEEKGMTIIPTEIEINEKGIAKVKISLAKGKHKYDKREDLKKKQDQREMQRRVKMQRY